MGLVLAFTPARRVTAIESSSVQGMLWEVDAGRDADTGMAKVAKAFASSQAEGLFTLATERLGAARALELGLVNRVVPDDRVLDETMDWARQLAERAFRALRRKALVQ